MAAKPVPHDTSSAVQDYAKAIYALQRRGQGAVSTNALAERLGVTAASASGMVKRLDEMGLVSHEPYRGVELTPDGLRLALEVIRHHRLLELYLAEQLDVPWDRVHEEAEVVRGALAAGVPQSMVVEELQREVERRLMRTQQFYDEWT